MSGQLHNLTLRQLYVFTTVVETGSFGSAAKLMGLSQPSISTHIEAIEDELRVSLFTRRPGRPPALTEHGHVFLEHAKRVLIEIDQLHRRIGAPRRRLEQITFACQRTIAHFSLSAPLAHYAQEHPEIDLVTRVGTQEEVVANVTHGMSDIGCLLSNRKLNEVDSHIVGKEEFAFIVAPDHPLARLKRVSPADIEDHAFVGPPRESMFGKALSELLAGIGIRRISSVSQATEYQVVKELVMAGVGVACSPRKGVERDISLGGLKELRLNIPPLTMNVVLIFPRAKRRSLLVRQFADRLMTVW